MQKLLTEGRTELLRGFISARTRRKFSAFLVRGADGKVGFEFEARAPKSTKSKVSKAADGDKTSPSDKKTSDKKTATKKRAAAEKDG
jgi:DNA topoisomerase-3